MVHKRRKKQQGAIDMASLIVGLAITAVLATTSVISWQNIESRTDTAQNRNTVISAAAITTKLATSYGNSFAPPSEATIIDWDSLFNATTLLANELNRQDGSYRFIPVWDYPHDPRPDNMPGLRDLWILASHESTILCSTATPPVARLLWDIDITKEPAPEPTGKCDANITIRPHGVIWIGQQYKNSQTCAKIIVNADNPAFSGTAYQLATTKQRPINNENATGYADGTVLTQDGLDIDPQTLESDSLSRWSTELTPTDRLNGRAERITAFLETTIADCGAATRALDWFSIDTYDFKNTDRPHDTTVYPGSCSATELAQSAPYPYRAPSGFNNLGTLNWCGVW